MGYNTARFKLVAFVLSAGLAGLAGAPKTLVLGFATLTDAHRGTSGLVVLMVLVGGTGTLLGPVIGALLVVALENKLGEVGAALGRVTGVEWFTRLGEPAVPGADFFLGCCAGHPTLRPVSHSRDGG